MAEGGRKQKERGETDKLGNPGNSARNISNNEKKGNPPKHSTNKDDNLLTEDSMDKDNNADVVFGIKDDHGFGQKEKATNMVGKMESGRSNDELQKVASDENSMKAMKVGMIPEKEPLAVRYVKMREKKMVAPGDSKDAGDKSETDEVTRMREKVLEGVLGVKAKRNEGERWVKMSVGEVESGTEINKRLKEVEKIVKINEEMENNRDNVDVTEENSEIKDKMEEEKSVKVEPRAQKLSNENITSRFTRTRNLVRKDCITLAREIRARRKAKSAAFKCSLERRVESAERILEDRVEKILEETAEKHPWLQPIENWLVDRYKSARTSSSKNTKIIHSSIGPSCASSDSESEKITEILEQRDNGEEKKDEESNSGEIFIDTVSKLSNEATRKENHSFLDPSSSKDSAESSPELSKFRDAAKVISDEHKEERTRGGKNEKVERHHASDLLDKLRGGFMEKVEDVQRV